jgi:hypothetical protein
MKRFALDENYYRMYWAAAGAALEPREQSDE